MPLPESKMTTPSSIMTMTNAIAGPSTPRPPQPSRTNSRSSIRTINSGRHVELSLARMASHETQFVEEDHPVEAEEEQEQHSGKGTGSGFGLARVRSNRQIPISGAAATQSQSQSPAHSQAQEIRMGDVEEGEESQTPTTSTTRTSHDSHTVLKKVEHLVESSGERMTEVAAGTLPPVHSEGIDGKVKRGEKTGNGEGEVMTPRELEAAETVGVGKKQVELQDQTNLLPVSQVLLIFAGLSCALFCSLLDQTIVTTALPTLGRVFNAADISSWVGTAYLLTSTACQPMYGRFSDVFGRKFVLLFSLAVFMLGSVLCGVAQSMIQLIVFRALQGVGGGGILTLVMIIVSDVVSLKDRGKYQGVLGGVVALSNSIGPVLGGVFTEKVTWRWCFYINIPLSAISILVVIFLLPLKRVKGDILGKLKKIDYLGSVLSFASALLIILGLSWAGSQYSWSSAAVIAPLVIGCFLAVVVIFVEWKVVALPIIPMHIFKNGTVAASMASTFFSGMIFYVNLYYLPQYYQVCRGASALESGVLLLPLILTQTVISFSSGVIVSKTGEYRWNLIAGFAIWTIGQGLLSTINQNTSTAKLVGYQLLSGVGAGQTFQTSLVAIQAAVKRNEMAVATGTRNFVRLLGGTVALAACSTILNNAVRSFLSEEGVGEGLIAKAIADPTSLRSIGLTSVEQEYVIEGYVEGIKRLFYFMTACAGVSTILVIFFVKHISLKRKDDEALKAEGKEWAQSHKHGHKAREKEAKKDGEKVGGGQAGKEEGNGLGNGAEKENEKERKEDKI